MKCDICSKKLATTFLGKIIGGYVKDKNGKTYPVCRECQKQFLTKEKLLEQIK